MKRFLGAVLLGVCTACGPQLGPPPYGPGEGSSLPPEHLRPTTADGEVIGVDGTQPARELAEGLTIRLQADADEPVAVQLAPGWYLRENGIGYGPSERMVVRGKRAMRGGQPVIIATEVEQGERRVPLRDESGRPLWKQTTPEE